MPDAVAADPLEPTRRRRRVLMLAYYFPPVGGAGVQRTLKHVKYLPRQGFDSIVITTRAVGHPIRDCSLASDVPEDTVVMRPLELPLHVVRWGLESVLRRFGLSARLARAVGWPDEFVGWAPGALFCALKAVRRYQPDVVYSTAFPVSAHVVAMLVKRITGLPWVADFRDPWSLNPQGAPFYKKASARLEGAIVRSADRVLVADESVRLLGVAPGDPRYVVLRNGVDADDLPTLVDDTVRPRFRIAYVGMLYGAMDAAPVFAALRRLISAGTVDREKVELHVVGARIDPSINVEGLPLTRRAYVTHRDALAEMSGADVLLLYLPQGWRASTTKVFEYLATGRPILAVVPSDSRAAQLVNELGAGVCVPPNDHIRIECAIAELYAAWSNGSLKQNPQVQEEAVRRFSREELAGQLADVLRGASA